MDLWYWLQYPLLFVALSSVVSYLILFIVDSFLLCEQNLKKKYNASWAVVTGASSGIGRAITEKLAAQDINVVLVALDDQVLSDFYKLICERHPDLEFRKCGVNLATEGYLEDIVSACQGIKPNLIFNNAGYIRTGLFADSSLDSQYANYTCNATAPMKITHHFINQMLNNKQRGAVTFTSSPAGLIPNPTAVLYGATKAFLTSFGASVAAEVRQDGIDVLVVHPSPVDTGFYSGNLHDVDAMKFFQKTATSPETIASCFFKSLGRTIVHDQGYFSISTKMILKLLDFNMLAVIISRTVSMSGDMVKVKKKRN